MKITVAGIGCVGLSHAVLLAAAHDVTVADISPERMEMLNAGHNPVLDLVIETHLVAGSLRLTDDISDCEDRAFTRDLSGAPPEPAPVCTLP